MRPRRRPLPSIRSRRWVGPVAVTAVVAVIGGVLLLQPRIGGQVGPGAASQAAGPGGGSAGSALPTAVPIPGHEVYGFIPYWEMDLRHYEPGRDRGRSIRLQPPAAARLGELRVPVLAVAGALDVSDIAATVQHLAAEAPDARAVVLTGVAHMIGMEAPGRLAELIVDFLAPLPRWR